MASASPATSSWTSFDMQLPKTRGELIPHQGASWGPGCFYDFQGVRSWRSCRDGRSGLPGLGSWAVAHLGVGGDGGTSQPLYLLSHLGQPLEASIIPAVRQGGF